MMERYEFGPTTTGESNDGELKQKQEEMGLGAGGEASKQG